ncbi:hypothetical protein DLAC_06765 [Tieghemostelium lacteum]|uniref:Uncharacterized protein n=1 Tax=Tieghemostelium lacteum TaxID=361077 RepID=A0A151ZFW7_TIELA|nr:hypothetical protein DLAC_06765 [Tieghemostelium lacteum]|eukprot:KYQ92760.1 hypothetical protein DLAC_06765 [Tieghemostelium lacteum]
MESYFRDTFDNTIKHQLVTEYKKILKDLKQKLKEGNENNNKSLWERIYFEKLHSLDYLPTEHHIYYLFIETLITTPLKLTEYIEASKSSNNILYQKFCYKLTSFDLPILEFTNNYLFNYWKNGLTHSDPYINVLALQLHSEIFTKQLTYHQLYDILPLVFKVTNINLHFTETLETLVDYLLKEDTNIKNTLYLETLSNTIAEFQDSVIKPVAVVFFNFLSRQLEIFKNTRSAIDFNVASVALKKILNDNPYCSLISDEKALQRYLLLVTPEQSIEFQEYLYSTLDKIDFTTIEHKDKVFIRQQYAPHFAKLIIRDSFDKYIMIYNHPIYIIGKGYAQYFSQEQFDKVYDFFLVENNARTPEYIGWLFKENIEMSKKHANSFLKYSIPLVNKTVSLLDPICEILVSYSKDIFTQKELDKLYLTIKDQLLVSESKRCYHQLNSLVNLYSLRAIPENTWILECIASKEHFEFNIEISRLLYRALGRITIEFPTEFKDIVVPRVLEYIKIEDSHRSLYEFLMKSEKETFISLIPSLTKLVTKKTLNAAKNKLGLEDIIDLIKVIPYTISGTTSNYSEEYISKLLIDIYIILAFTFENIENLAIRSHTYDQIARDLTGIFSSDSKYSISFSKVVSYQMNNYFITYIEERITEHLMILTGEATMDIDEDIDSKLTERDSYCKEQYNILLRLSTIIPGVSADIVMDYLLLDNWFTTQDILSSMIDSGELLSAIWGDMSCLLTFINHSLSTKSMPKFIFSKFLFKYPQLVLSSPVLQKEKIYWIDLDIKLKIKRDQVKELYSLLDEPDFNGYNPDSFPVISDYILSKIIRYIIDQDEPNCLYIAMVSKNFFDITSKILSLPTGCARVTYDFDLNTLKDVTKSYNVYRNGMTKIHYSDLPNIPTSWIKDIQILNIDRKNNFEVVFPNLRILEILSHQYQQAKMILQHSLTSIEKLSIWFSDGIDELDEIEEDINDPKSDYQQTMQSVIGMLPYLKQETCSLKQLSFYFCIYSPTIEDFIKSIRNHFLLKQQSTTSSSSSSKPVYWLDKLNFYYIGVNTRSIEISEIPHVQWDSLVFELMDDTDISPFLKIPTLTKVKFGGMISLAPDDVIYFRFPHVTKLSLSMCVSELLEVLLKCRKDIESNQVLRTLKLKLEFEVFHTMRKPEMVQEFFDIFDKTKITKLVIENFRNTERPLIEDYSNVNTLKFINYNNILFKALQ